MENIRYTVIETFSSSDPAAREERLRSLMAEYLRSVEQQVLQSDYWG